jgi:hypothetical protein
MADAPQALPDIDFATFVLSLGSSVLMHLGEPLEEGGEPQPPNLALAKQTIDLMAMIQAKTKGNLDAAEDQLLSGLLYDLRIRYVDARQKKK